MGQGAFFPIPELGLKYVLLQAGNQLQKHFRQTANPRAPAAYSSSGLQTFTESGDASLSAPQTRLNNASVV